MEVHADDRQKMLIWTFMYDKGMLSDVCIRHWYFSHLTWSNIHLETHNLNHIFFKIGFEQAEMSQCPTKLACMTAGRPDPEISRKRKISSEPSPRASRKRQRRILSRMHARYHARQSAKRKKLAALGYPCNSSDEYDALQRDFVAQRNVDNGDGETENEDANEKTTEDSENSERLSEGGDVDHVIVGKKAQGENQPIGTEGETVTHDGYIDDDYNNLNPILPPCGNRTAIWVNKSPAPMDYEPLLTDKKSIPSESDPEQEPVTVTSTSKKPKSKAATSVEDDEQLKEWKRVLALSKLDADINKPSTSTHPLPTTYGAARTDAERRDANVTLREKNDEKRQSGISDLTLSDATSTFEPDPGYEHIALMSTQELIEFSQSSVESLHAGDRDNACDGKF